MSRFGASLAGILIVLQLGMTVRADYVTNELQVDSAGQNPALRLSFHEFYSPELFGEVKEYLAKSAANYRVVSLGMYPAIALYNGLPTADGYWVNYPLDYKHRFRRIIAGELAANENLRNYFDRWGSRCYLFSHELGRNCLATKKAPRREVEQLRVDCQAMADLGITHIVSAVRIANHRALGLRLEKQFDRDDSPWQIFLYAVPRLPRHSAAGVRCFR
jgi:hypothetical protein